MTLTRRPLFAGVLRKDISKHFSPEPVTAGFSPAEREIVRVTMQEGRDVRERTINHVVERLLNELTW